MTKMSRSELPGPEWILSHLDAGRLWSVDAGRPADAHAAYGLALAVRELRVARGELPRGYKIGFTNRSIWPRYNVHAPIWGTIWNTTISECEGAGAVSLARVCQPRIEPEAVFGFRAAPRDASLAGIFAALDWVAPGFEIVQSHSADWKFEAVQAMADGALHAHLLVGQKTPVARLAAGADELERSLAAARVVLHRQGEPVEQGLGANVLDGPLHALAHFIAELRACPGAADLRAGDIVTTGTWTDAWPVASGERWLARFDSVLPPLEVRFE